MRVPHLRVTLAAPHCIGPADAFVNSEGIDA